MKRSTFDFEQPFNENHGFSPWRVPAGTQNHYQKPSQNSIRFWWDFRLQNCSKMVPKWSQNVAKNALKNHSKNHQKNDAEIISKWMPKRSPGEPRGDPKSLPGNPGTPPGHPGGVQGVLGDSRGVPGLPPGRPRHQKYTKFDLKMFKILKKNHKKNKLARSRLPEKMNHSTTQPAIPSWGLAGFP